jgi:HPt (histidine-containing phosphotransfer) domain-containing protein
VHEHVTHKLDEMDSQAALLITRAVKGNAANIGAIRLSQAAAGLEKAIAEKGSSIDFLLDEFENALNHTIRAISDLLQTEK